MSTHGRSTRRFKMLARNLRAARQQCWNYPNCEGIDYDAPAGHPRAFTVDHIRPLSVYPEGAEDPSNLRASCHGCNASRGNGDAHPVTQRRTCVCGCGGTVHLPGGAMTSRDWENHADMPGWPTAPTEPTVERTYSP